jgi:GNAT superfamily N-acetyltransferase
METKIRYATTDDQKTITRFQMLMADETENVVLEKNTIENGVKAVFDNPQLGRYYVAEINGQVVACLLTTFEWSDWRNAMVWWLQSVYVLPEYRKTGVFREMYLHIKNLVLSNEHVGGIRLYMITSNDRARKAYQAMGMDGEHYQLFEWMK